MIQSIFLLSPTGEVLIERHYRETHAPRSICDYYWSIVSEVGASPLGHGATFSPTGTVMIGGPDGNGSGSIPAPPVGIGYGGSGRPPMYDVADVPPVMSVPTTGESGGDGQDQCVLFNVHRGGLHYLAACPGEVSPLLVVEFLHRVADVFVEYFGAADARSTAASSLAGSLLGGIGGVAPSGPGGFGVGPCGDGGVDEHSVKENFSTVYQLLEEMMDHGWPLTTEASALKDSVRPPLAHGALRRLAGAGHPEGTESSPHDLPWRKANVRHTQNEIYVDIVEEIDAVVDGVDGRLLSADVSGHVSCQSQLSGLPDLSLAFQDPEVVGDDCSFHPCVRYSRYERDRVISFVPPDGNFELMRYRVRLEAPPHPPVAVVPQISYGGGADEGKDGAETTPGSVMVHVSVRAESSLLRGGANCLEDVSIEVPFTRQVRMVSDLRVTSGRVTYDEHERVARWHLGRLDPGRPGRPAPALTLTGRLEVSGPRPRSENPPVRVRWRVPGASVSGLEVAGLSVGGVGYRPYKGVRTVTRTGNYFVRCG